jgi:transcription elongation GreA/GreB family factor
METKNLKEHLLNYCINHQKDAIERLQKEIDDAQKMANDYGAPKDRYDSFRTKMMRQRDMFAQQQAKANTVLNTLHKISLDKEFDKVEFGSVVITNKQKLFVSAGIGKIETNGQTFYAISPVVPIYKALEGKKAGDEVIFNGMKIVIEKVF